MPFDASRYPADWKAISLRIREREGWRCKWCGVRNTTWVYNDGGSLVVLDATNRDEATMEAPQGARVYRVCLTVAHLGTPHADGRPGDKHDKMDCREENLAALCQRCHLLYDIKEHVQNAARTRLAKKQALYVPMFEEGTT